MFSSEPGTEVKPVSLHFSSDCRHRRMVLLETWGYGKLMDDYVLSGFIHPWTFFLASTIIARNKSKREMGEEHFTNSLSDLFLWHSFCAIVSMLRW